MTIDTSQGAAPFLPAPGKIINDGLELLVAEGFEGTVDAMNVMRNTGKVLMSFIAMFLLPILIGTGFIPAADAAPLAPPDQQAFLEFSTTKLASAGIDNRFNLGNNFTIEAWVSLAKDRDQFGMILGKPIINGAQTLSLHFGLAATGNAETGLFVNGIQSAGNEDTVAGLGAPVESGKWFHVAFVNNAGGLDLYIDGQLAVSGAAIAASVESNDMPFSLGSWADPVAGAYLQDGFMGGLREVRIWNIARDPESIRESAAVRLNGSENGLVAYWRLDTVSQTVTDHSSSGLDLFLGNTANIENSDAMWGGVELWNTPAFESTGQRCLIEPDCAFSAGGLVFKDIDLDGLPDVLAHRFEARPLQLKALRNIGEFEFVDATDALLGEFEMYLVRDHVLADFNGDGIEDLFLCGEGTDAPGNPGEQSRILVGRESGILEDLSATHFPMDLGNCHGVAAGDIDGDNDLDLVLTYIGCDNCSVANGPTLYINDGQAKFTRADDNAVPGGLPKRLRDETFGFGEQDTAEMADIDNDGDIDIIFGLVVKRLEGILTFGSTTQILLNDGTGRFEIAPASVAPGRQELAGFVGLPVVKSDINRDGWIDLVVGYQHAEGQKPAVVQLLINNRDGTFSDETEARIDGYELPPMEVTVVDLNGDGWDDLFATNGTPDVDAKGGPNRIWINNGGIFLNATEALPGLRSGIFETVYATDFDGDSLVDLVTLKGSSYRVSRNTGRFFVPSSAVLFNPDRSGEGILTFVQTINHQPVIFAVWFAYQDGEQLWLSGVANITKGLNRVAIPMQVTSGASFGADFNATDVIREDWGTVTLTMNSCSDWTVNYSKNGGDEGTLSLVPLLIPDGETCSKNRIEPIVGEFFVDSHATGTYFDPARDGEGILTFVQKIDGQLVLFATWFTYENGKQMWLSGNTNVAKNTNTVTVPMVVTRGTGFGSAFDADDVIRESWGTIKLDFTVCGSLNVTYTPNETAPGSITMTQLLAADGATCDSP